MQQTRRLILDILREHREATVDELVRELKVRIQHDITAVTVRHHLDILRGEDLVTSPIVRRNGGPGRPQYIYALTAKAAETFPNNYPDLLDKLLAQIKAQLPSTQVNVIFEGVADQMITDARLPDFALYHVPMEARLDHVVGYLSRNGYEAHWEPSAEGYILHTRNCPYHKLAGTHDQLCTMDMRLVAGLTGVIPRRLGRLVENDESCAYLFPVAAEQHHAS
jgi:predicted ArsR family transcriptional regulator